MWTSMAFVWWRWRFQSHNDFGECLLSCVYREPVWCRESLQRRKAFEKLLPVSSPPLHCTFVSLSPLTPSFSLSLPIILGVVYKVTVFLCWAAGLCGLMILCGYLFSFLGSPSFPPPHRESPHWKALWWVVAPKQSSTVWGTRCAVSP